MRAGAVEGFVFYLQTQGRAKPTIKNYTTYAKQWLEWCLECHIDPLKATTEDLMSWLGWMTDNRMPSTVRLATLTMRVYYDYLKAAKIVRVNPARKIAVRKQVARPVAQLEPHEVKRMIGACETLEDKAMLLLMVGGGLRRAEVLGITREDIDFNAGTIRIYGKGRKWREVAPGNACMGAVKAALAWRARLFTNTHADSLRRRLNEIVARSGIGKQVHPHMLRYYFAVHFCENGGGIDHLQSILGHSSLEMSMFYSKHGLEKRAQQAQVKFNPADMLTS
jgi:site-specific recombinase XerD